MTAACKFKGGTFDNRYKITAVLTLSSPLHIGDGESTTNDARLPKKKNMKKIPEFSTVATDVNGRAYIPGSTLKGNLRAWLTQIFSPLDLATANDNAREAHLRAEWERCVEKKQTQNILNTLKLTEYLFGSPINEGKLEFQDALMQTPPSGTNHNMQALAGYDHKRGTMILKGVAIDPVSGTAAKNKLYNYEAIPPGARFGLSITGQNLTDVELGMLLFALEGFNSEIYPVTLGAMAGIGFGRGRFTFERAFCLNSKNLKTWLQNAIATGHAGYTGLAELAKPDCDLLINGFRSAFQAAL